MERFGLSPLIRFTLLSLYLALVLPLPLLAPPSLRLPMAAGLVLGLVLVVGLLSEQVETDITGIQVRYPVWIRWLLRRGWSMPWSDIRPSCQSAPARGGRSTTSKPEISVINSCPNGSNGLTVFCSCFRPTVMSAPLESVGSPLRGPIRCWRFSPA